MHPTPSTDPSPPSTPDAGACCAPGCCAPPSSQDQPVTLNPPERIRYTVRERYGAIAREGVGGCGPVCCSPAVATDASVLGYSAEDQANAPEGTNLGLGCGNPQAIAALRPGERVLDLGSGAGFDAFLAANAVGPTGWVIGVDMTQDMLSRARARAKESGLTHIEFRLGEIEHLPLADATVDVVISNCVVNLSPDKPAVFREAFRVLRPGGRLAIADVVARQRLSAEHQADLALLVGCIAGAATVSELEGWLGDAGFIDIHLHEKRGSAELVESWAPGHPAASQVMSATIEARKP